MYLDLLHGIECLVFLQTVWILVVMIRDFNQVLHPCERQSRVCGHIQRANQFRQFLNKNGLVELSSSVVMFTWTNNRQGKDVCYEKLDRVVLYTGFLVILGHL